MVNAEKIEIDDVVSVNINAAQCTLSPKAKVQYMPCQPTDYWIFKCLKTGKVIQTNEPVTVELIQKWSEEVH